MLHCPAVTLFGVEQAARAAGFSVNLISLDNISQASLEQAMAQLSRTSERSPIPRTAGESGSEPIYICRERIWVEEWRPC